MSALSLLSSSHRPASILSHPLPSVLPSLPPPRPRPRPRPRPSAHTPTSHTPPHPAPASLCKPHPPHPLHGTARRRVSRRLQPRWLSPDQPKRLLPLRQVLRHPQTRVTALPSSPFFFLFARTLLTCILLIQLGPLFHSLASTRSPVRSRPLSTPRLFLMPHAHSQNFPPLRTQGRQVRWPLLRDRTRRDKAPQPDRRHRPNSPRPRTPRLLPRCIRPLLFPLRHTRLHRLRAPRRKPPLPHREEPPHRRPPRSRQEHHPPAPPRPPVPTRGMRPRPHRHQAREHQFVFPLFFFCFPFCSENLFSAHLYSDLHPRHRVSHPLRTLRLALSPIAQASHPPCPLPPLRSCSRRLLLFLSHRRNFLLRSSPRHGPLP